MPSLSFSSGSGTDVLSGIVNFLQNGGSATTVLTASFLGVIVSPFIALADIINAIGTFFSRPFESGGQTIADLFNGLLGAPARLVGTGADISANALRSVFGETFAGIFALPITVGLALLGIYMIGMYLNEEETGDAIVGLPIDAPTDFLGAEEEATADE